MKISKWAKLGRRQAELDFVDVDPKKDTRLFVDPYAIEIRDDAWSKSCGKHIRSYFNALIQALRAGNDARAFHLASHLHEAEETYLGLSRGEPQGRGVGREQAGRIINALRRSKAFQSGLLSDLGETELFIEGIGPDKISDLTTNVIRGPLLAYTKQQAEFWNMPLTKRSDVGAVWNPNKEEWEQAEREVLVVGGKPVILVPKVSTRLRLSLNSQEFYNHHMVNYLQAEYLQAGQALVHVLKNGDQRVYKGEVKEAHPFSKPDLADFARQHPDILEHYKKMKGAQGALDNDDIEKDFREGDHAVALISELARIKSGNASASEYHRFCMAALTFLFYPNLITPIKEREIDQGRKRIDITYTNAARDGFFHTALISPQMRSLEIPVECKNYSSDIANPELDQLGGRFSHTSGFLGLLCSRTFDDKAKFIERCKDSALKRGHYILPLDDNDLVEMLRLVENGQRRGVTAVLARRLREISA